MPNIGDVRRTFAVDRPELRHLKNVIVFSVKGDRDLPNMLVFSAVYVTMLIKDHRLGGGDLDGDGQYILVLRTQQPG